MDLDLDLDLDYWHTGLHKTIVRAIDDMANQYCAYAEIM
jgi:predicted NAD/FAD-binding protein